MPGYTTVRHAGDTNSASAMLNPDSALAMLNTDSTSAVLYRQSVRHARINSDSVSCPHQQGQCAMPRRVPTVTCRAV